MPRREGCDCQCPDGIACLGESVPRVCELARTRKDYRDWVAAGCPSTVAPAAASATAAVAIAATRGPGTILHDWLAGEFPGWAGDLLEIWAGRRSLFAESAGCACASDAAEMDRLGADGVRARIDEYAGRLSAKPQAANVPPWLVKQAILAACDAAERDAQRLRNSL